MAEVYYGVSEVIFEPPEDLYTSRRDKMKLARYLPAVIKDIEVATMTIAKISESKEFDASEFKFTRGYHLSCFRVKSEFSTNKMSEDEIVKNCIERAKVITEWRKKFRTWLPSSERKQCYESTKMQHETLKLKNGDWWFTGVAGLIKWRALVKSKKIREKLIQYHIYRYLDHGAPLFTSDGYGIIGHRIRHEYKFSFKVDRGQKVFERLKPIPFEEIEFLKEGFPEMFE
jgi:hypothetical protein